MKSCMPIKLFLGCELHLFFGATLLSNCQLPLHYNQALYVRVWCLSALLSDSMLQKMTTWLPSTNHCAIAMLLWFRCVVSQQSWHWHWFFPTKISLFRHWLDGVYFTTNSYFLDCLILYEKVPSNTYTTFTLQDKSMNNFDNAGNISALLCHFGWVGFRVKSKWVHPFVSWAIVLILKTLSRWVHPLVSWAIELIVRLG